MVITCGKERIETTCRGCMCHDLPMQFGELYKGCCSECGCPKTKEAFDRIKRGPDPTGEEGG